MTLYTSPYCGACDRVRDELERRGVGYDEVSVGWGPLEREEVFRLSGQHRVPVLVDGERVIHDSRRILTYLRETYSGGGGREPR